MISNISFEYSPLWLVPLLIGAAAAVWVLYFSDELLSRNKRIGLATLRFLSLFILSLLLLAPLLKVNKTYYEKPILLWLEDNSKSMLLGAKGEETKSWFSQNRDAYIKALSEKYDVNIRAFGADITLPNDSFLEVYSNIGLALENGQEQFYNQNISGVVLLSDGIYNQGLNPLYSAQQSSIPIYTVGFGDTSVVRDIFIDKLVHNEITYLGNTFPVEVFIKARKLKDLPFELSITDAKGNKVFSEKIKIEGNTYFKKVVANIKTQTIGLQRYNVQISAVGNEQNVNNNYQYFSIEVMDNRKRIHIIGGAPNPDMGAIASALKALEKYDVETFYIKDYRPTGEKVDLYILHQPTEEMLYEMNLLKSPYWIINGASPYAVSLQKEGVDREEKAEAEKVFLKLETLFSLFTLQDDFIAYTASLPPLVAPFGKLHVRGNTNPLFYKKIGNINTKEPLWFFKEEDGLRKSYLLASGLWRWRMYDYQQNKSFKNFDGLIAQTVQYLTAKEKDRRFVVEHKSRFSSDEKINMIARLYNRSLELDNTADVKILVKGEKGESYDYSFSKASNTYTLQIGSLPEGNYTYKANTSFGEETFERDGAFSVEKIEVEASDVLARFDVLRSVAEESEGQFYTKEKADALVDYLLEGNKASSIQRTQTDVSHLLHKKWVFFIILFLLGMEWGLRKYFGKY